MKTSQAQRVAMVRLGGDEWTILPRSEYDRLVRLARVAEMPPLPKPDASGTFPAVDYARASIARRIVGERMMAGLSQKDLAARAGVRVETLCRIEKGYHTASTTTIAKIERALLKDRRGARRRSAS